MATNEENKPVNCYSELSTGKSRKFKSFEIIRTKFGEKRFYP